MKDHDPVNHPKHYTGQSNHRNLTSTKGAEMNAELQTKLEAIKAECRKAIAWHYEGDEKSRKDRALLVAIAIVQHENSFHREAHLQSIVNEWEAK